VCCDASEFNFTPPSGLNLRNESPARGKFNSIGHHLW
jgi:hypothetical protein